VTAGMIADELKHQFDITLDKRKIHLAHPIRTLGEQEVELRLHHDVNAMLKLRIESTTPLPAAPEAAEPEGRVTEKRGKARQEAAATEEKAEATDKKPKAAKAEKAPKAEKPAKKSKGE
jgi:large subunit ribosomal protein L9